MPPGRDQQLTNLSSATPESSVVEWVALASPSPRAPLLAKVERLAAPLRQAVAVVASVLCVDAASYAAVYAPRVPDLGYCAVGVDAPQRAAWMLVGQWLTGYALGELDGDATLSDAE